MNMFNMFIMAQIVGIFATVCSLVIVQFKNIRHILIGEIAANLLVSINYAMLGGISGAGVCMLAIAQTVWIYFYTKKDRTFPIPATIICILGYTAISIFSYGGWISIISWLAAIAYALSVVQTQSSKYRIYMLINSALWVAYDIFTGAYTTIITHGFLIVSILAAMIRMDRKQNE